MNMAPVARAIAATKKYRFILFLSLREKPLEEIEQKNNCRVWGSLPVSGNVIFPTSFIR
jgi:hypothetical protein